MLTIVNTHPIQYFAPMYRMLNEELAGNLSVIYCSRMGVDAARDEGFGRSFGWDIDLLTGYDCVFLPEASANRECDPNVIDCSSLTSSLEKMSPGGIVVHGYVGNAARTAIAWARKRRRRLYLRGDTWAGRGELGNIVRRVAKRCWAKTRLAPYVTGYLAVGALNAQYWAELGATPGRTWLVPYGIDGECYRPIPAGSHGGATGAERLRVGFFGKFTERKGILQFLREWVRHQDANRPQVEFLLVGDGALRGCIEEQARLSTDRVVIKGFRNQSELPDLYRSCQIVIMPSLFETWGFSVQEALACGVPVLCGDAVPAGREMIKEPDNGWILPSGDWRAWVAAVSQVAAGSVRFDQAVVAKLADRIPTFRESARAFAVAVQAHE